MCSGRGSSRCSRTLTSLKAAFFGGRRVFCTNRYGLRLPGERHALESESLGDEVGDQVAGEPQMHRQVDAYLRVVVAEVLRDVEVTARVGLLPDGEGLHEDLVQRHHPLAPQLPGQQPVRK